MILDSSMYDGPSHIHRIFWCYPEDNEKAIELLKNEVFSVAKKMKEDIDKIIKFVI